MMEQSVSEYQIHLDETRRWAGGLDTVAALIGKQFPRAEPRQRAMTYCSRTQGIR
jgi:hypothetical protein